MQIRQDWKFNLFVTGLIIIGLFVGGLAASYGAELPVRHAKHAKVSVTMKRERGPAPVYVPPSPVPPIDRPAGVP